MTAPVAITGSDTSIRASALRNVPSTSRTALPVLVMAWVPALTTGVVVWVFNRFAGTSVNFFSFLGVHALESYVLTPLIQRQALDIPPATLFAFQILLGVVFGIWGLALALPLMAIVVAALVMYLVFRDRGPFVRYNAANALNVQIAAGIVHDVAVV